VIYPHYCSSGNSPVPLLAFDRRELVRAAPCWTFTVNVTSPLYSAEMDIENKSSECVNASRGTGELPRRQVMWVNHGKRSCRARHIHVLPHREVSAFYHFTKSE